MTFEKGQTQNRGEHLSAETKAKIIKWRKAGKKWREIAEELKIPTKRAMTYAKRKWFKAGMSLENEVKSDDNKKDNPTVDTGAEEKGEGKGSVENDKEDKGVVGKVKEKAAANIDQAISKHIKKTDKAPKSVKKDSNLNNDKGTVDEGAKTGLSGRKSVNIWFLLAIIIAVATIGLIFIILKPKGVEKAEYNKPTKEEDKGGYQGRKLSELN